MPPFASLLTFADSEPSRPLARSLSGAGRRITLAVLIAVAAAGHPTTGGAQVIQSYEGLDRSAGEGWYATVALALDVSAGNSEYVDLDASGAFGHLGAKNWIRLYPGYRVKRSGSASVVDERTAHLRHSWLFTDRTRSYAFVQLQADRALELERRVLVGGGLRHRILLIGEDGGLDLGLGVMWEEEKLSTGMHDDLFRGANLVAASGRAGSVDLTLTGYFQPALGNWADHRIAANGSAAVPLGDAWALTVSARFRRDSRPPTEVEEDDAGLSVGLRFSVN